MQTSIVGVWTLRSLHTETIETGERTEPFGPESRGRLILQPDGLMAALITPRERAAPVTEADQAAAFQKLVAYSGRYRLEPPDRLVTTVDVASFANWIGTDQTRTYKLDGDRLDIFTPAGRMPRPDGTEVTVMGVLSWDREAPAAASEPHRVSG